MLRFFLPLILLSAVALGQITNVNLGTTANDGTGDSARKAFGKINTNFAFVVAAKADRLAGIQVLSAESGLYAADPTNGYVARVFTGTTSVDWNWNSTEGGPDVSGERIRPTNYVTGSWIAGTAWATAKSSSALKGLGFDASGRIVASTATKQQVDATAMQVATVASMRALTSAQINNGQLIQTGGYYTNGDGGGVTMAWISTSTETTNYGSVLSMTGSATGRLIDISKGPIYAKSFGVVGDGVTDDTAAINSALAVAAAGGREAKVILPVGTFKITSTLIVSNGVSLIGAGYSAYNTTASQIVMYTDNTPIITITGAANLVAAVGGSVQWLGLSYNTLQPTTATSSACVLIKDETFRVFLEGLEMRKGAYGINSEGVSPQAIINYVWVKSFSVTAFRAINGTTWTIDNLYVQNLFDKPSGVVDVVNVTNVTVSGSTNIVFYCDAPLTYLNTNRVFNTTLLDSAYNGSWVAYAISGNNIYASSTIPMSAPVDVTGRMAFRDLPCAGPAVNLSSGVFAIHGLDIEHVIPTNGVAFQTAAESVSIDNLWLEGIYTPNNAIIINNFSKSLKIDGLSFVNSGVLPGNVATLLYTQAGNLIVDGLSTRDIAFTGATYIEGLRFPTTAARPTVRTRDYTGSVRAYTTGTPTHSGDVEIVTTDAQRLAASSGIEIARNNNLAVVQSGTAGYSADNINVTETSLGSGVKYLLERSVGGTDVFRVNNTGFTEIGTSTLGRALELTGNNGGAPALRLNRPSSGQSVDFSVSGGLIISWPPTSRSLIQFVDTSSSVVSIYGGGASPNAAPRIVEYRGEPASGANVASQYIRIRPGTSTGNAQSGYVNILTGVTGSSGSSTQSELTTATFSEGGLLVQPSGTSTITPSATAAFEIRSTIKGSISSPVMTTAQRNAISSPATGLQVFCSDCIATDGSTGVSQTYSSGSWRNHY